MVKIWLCIFTSIFVASAQAAKFKGYQRSVSASDLVIEESIERYIENASDFLILLDRHQAFYRFPKVKEYEILVRGFLDSRVKDGKKVRVEIDAKTGQINGLSDKKND